MRAEHPVRLHIENNSKPKNWQQQQFVRIKPILDLLYSVTEF